MEMVVQVDVVIRILMVLCESSGPIVEVIHQPIDSLNCIFGEYAKVYLQWCLSILMARVF
ncbi:hypothetical protein AMTR_s00008p00222280 [Amborella trichopoda]|uniref:Uncharacterized protein n=1 Tax=Amborella trichopoda TaxID=13333 RepID=W1NJN4_AMBTC|nr:hypothetical protein AMTR_s00008p00222280 [Amborella trichopoda]